MKMTDKIDINELGGDDIGLFLNLIVGLIKFHLDKLDNEYENVFDVYFQDGGAGSDFVSVSKLDTDAEFCFGVSEGTLSYTIISGVSRGIVEGGEFLDNPTPTFEEINSWISDFVNLFFVEKEIEKKEYKNFIVKGMNYTKTIKISKEKNESLQSFLDGDGEGTLNTVETFTADFGDNGEGHIEIDIKVCDGDNPFVDAVMFQDGHEVGCLDCADTIVGEYPFLMSLKDGYTVIIEEE